MNFFDYEHVENKEINSNSMLPFLDSVLDTVLFTGTIITEFSQPCYNAIIKTMCEAHQIPRPPHPDLIISHP